MPDADGFAADLAGAILDGDPIDWPSLESSVSQAERPVLDQLKLLARVADVHRRPPAPGAADHWGHLRVLERIGAGAYGVVHRAWDTRLDREVALKLMPAPVDDTAGRVTSIIEEGRLLARVRHPNIVTIYGAEEIAGAVGLWMELIEGKTLEELIEGGRVFTPSEARHIGIELCHAMTAVHGAGLLHRDIKAHNVMLADDERVVLMDFGTGRELDDQPDGPVAGTPLYLAPEIFRGRSASPGSDVYSAGVLLFHLLTGKYPVAGGTLHDFRLAHERGERTALELARPDLPRRLCQVIERAIDSQPERRYQSAADMARDLASHEPRAWRDVWRYAAAGVAASVVLAFWLAPGLRDQPGAGANGSRSLPGLAAAGANDPLARAATPVIAVLPLENLSAEAGSDYFADGLTDEIIRNLTVIDGVEVRSRTSSFYYKDKPRNLGDVGRQLGATFVVEGSVLRDGRRLRINVQLVQVDGDVPLWSERFDRELADVFVVQDEISRAIVNKLRLSVGQGQRRYDTDVELYDLYLKARDRLGQRGERGLGQVIQEAAKLFEEVVARDPAFAPAHAGLAMAYAHMSMSPYRGQVFEQARSRVRPAALRALQLDPLLAEAHAAMGWLHVRELNWPSAEKSFERALELSRTVTPLSVDYVFSTLRPLGKLDHAERLLRQALTHDPLSWEAQRELVSVFLQSGRYEQAIALNERIRSLDQDKSDFYLDRDLGRALTFIGKYEEALAVFTARGFTVPGAEHWLALPYVMTGRRAAAEKLANGQNDYPFRLAFIYAALGDESRALDALELMFEREPQRLVMTTVQPEFAGLRDDPRWIALRRKLKLPTELPLQPRP